MIDVARFYGIALVYYGHFIEQFMLLRVAPGHTQYKFIYSFHMLLFFILAGYVSKQRDLTIPLTRFLKYRCLSRLLPFVFFNCLLMVLSIFFSGQFFGLRVPSLNAYATGAVLTVFGFPVFNIPTWFLLCLFSVELVHYLTGRYLSSNTKILLAALIFYVGGYLLNWRFLIFNPMRGQIVGWNYLYIHEAVLAYAFYLVGVYLRRKRFLLGHLPWPLLTAAIIGTLLFVLFTYNLNQGPFRYYRAVLIMLSGHGNILLFPLTAIVGSVFVLLLAKATASSRFLAVLGQHALTLFCLNGIFYHFVNHRIAVWAYMHLAGRPLIISALALGVTIASLLACLPLVFLFHRFIPQLVGKPRTNGPLLPRLTS
jgi:acyltransferase